MPLEPRERDEVVDQILLIVEQLYAHRVLKEALYGIDAVALLRALRLRAAELSDEGFHREMRAAVNQLRDRHTRYEFSGNDSYLLPFVVEKAFERSVPIYLVTKSTDCSIPVGSSVVRWNGVPTELVVDALSRSIGAGNETARRALAVRFLTERNGLLFDRPEEDEVLLDLIAPTGEAFTAKTKWNSGTPARVVCTGARALTGLGIDPDLHLSNQRLYRTFSARFLATAPPPYCNVETRSIDCNGEKYAYLRIFDFSVDDADDFAHHVANLLTTLPPTGVIIDLRGNPGGYIKAGEILLQLFSSSQISPNGFRFRASDAVDYLILNCAEFSNWLPTVAQGRRIGAEHSSIFPIEDDEPAFNKIGRVYPGPSVLIVDALTFSTGDMFTAAYKDNRVGPVICTDENTAAGGANNWTYDILRFHFPGFLLPPAAEVELETGKIGPALITAFNVHAQAISASATVTGPIEDDIGSTWHISEAGRSYRVVRADWLRPELGVYFDHDNGFVGDLPSGVGFEFSVRQAVRHKASDGLVLEDDGIVADFYYQMTRVDVLESNRDLIAFACGVLKSLTSECTSTAGSTA